MQHMMAARAFAHEADAPNFAFAGAEFVRNAALNSRNLNRSASDIRFGRRF
jgi:hypothetical protein